MIVIDRWSGRTVVGRAVVGGIVILVVVGIGIGIVVVSISIVGEVVVVVADSIVARVAHEQPHEGIATEWFGHGQTIAMLPLNGDVSSVVLTLPPHKAERLMVGSSLVDDDESRAVVRAVLDALNRIMPDLRR